LVRAGIEEALFRGNHPTRVDEKGRLKLPAEFKRRVDELYGPQFYITSTDGKRAQIYPLKEWEKIEASLATMSPFDPVRKKFLDVTNYYGQMAEMDAQGRLLIPQKLRDLAKVMGDVNVMGFQTMLEAVKEEMLDSQVKNADGVVELTNGDLMAVADKTKSSD
jgi:MraZ protein